MASGHLMTCGHVEPQQVGDVRAASCRLDRAQH